MYTVGYFLSYNDLICSDNFIRCSAPALTTLINTHDMNSVMGIGEKIIYIYEGHKEWEGSKNDIFTSTNERLNNFIFASDLFRKVKEVEIQNIEG